MAKERLLSWSCPFRIDKGVKVNFNNDKRKNILVVEDEFGIARICLRVLNAEGFDVEIAANGKIAKNTLGLKEYDLYVVDIRTPEMNGMELYQFMAQEFPGTTKKVLFTTGDTLSSNIKDFLDRSRRPYLAKPFTPDELRSLVKTALSLS
jgi:DNA-binding response OmpR family regulator